MFMGKDTYLFEKVIFKGFKDSIVINIHGQEELQYFELKIHSPNTLKCVNVESQKHEMHL